MKQFKCVLKVNGSCAGSMVHSGYLLFKCADVDYEQKRIPRSGESLCISVSRNNCFSLIILNEKNISCAGLHHTKLFLNICSCKMARKSTGHASKHLGVSRKTYSISYQHCVATHLILHFINFQVLDCVALKFCYRIFSLLCNVKKIFLQQALLDKNGNRSTAIFLGFRIRQMLNCLVKLGLYSMR